MAHTDPVRTGLGLVPLVFPKPMSYPAGSYIRRQEDVLVSKCAEAVSSGWCPLCYAGIRGRRTYKGHSGYSFDPQARWRVRMSLIKRAQVAQAPPPVVVPDGLPCCVFRLPAVTEFLTLAQWDDGKRRQLGSLSVFFQDGVFKLAVNDKDAGLSAFVSAQDLSDLFMLAEGALTEGTLSWRPSYTRQKKEGRKS